MPGRWSVLSKMVTARRYAEPDYLRRIGPQLYGGVFRRRPELLLHHGRHLRSPRGRGYFYQLLASWGWLRQPTLVMAGSDDPIVPLFNAKVLAKLIRRARLHVVDDGHLFLATRASSTRG